MSRVEIPSSTNNLFYFADIDRDSLVDMLFVTKNDMRLHIYYNKLLNVYEERNGPASGVGSLEPKAFGMKNLCAPTNRQVPKIKDVFANFNNNDEKFVLQ